MSGPLAPRLARSRSHRWIAGVCGGIAEYLGWSPTALRLVYVVVSVLSAAFPGLLVYALLWLVMPEADGRGDGTRWS